MGRASRRKQNRKAGKRTSAEIFQNVRRALQVARRGAQDVRDSVNAERRMIGVCNVITFGRSAVHILEHLRGTEAGFDMWYQRYADDPVMKFLVELRNQILKEGELRTQVEMKITELHGDILKRNLPPAPPGAKEFFIGDEFGGNGWEVELADGETEKFYVELPKVPGLLIDQEVQFVNPLLDDGQTGPRSLAAGHDQPVAVEATGDEE